MSQDSLRKNHEEATKAAHAHKSPRYIELERLESWVTGDQYRGRPNWWSQDVPLWEREPCIVIPVVATAIDSNVDLCLGEGRFPTFSVGDEPPKVPGKPKPVGQNPVESYLSEWHAAVKFATAMREAFAAAQGSRSAMLLQGVRNGKPFAQLFPAKWCEPKLDPDGVVLSVEIRYPYVEDYKVGNEWRSRVMLYRRTIDEKADTVYLPAEASGTEPAWKVDVAQTTVHGLGFCPVVWYAHMKGCQAANVIDGRAIHETITDEIQGLDIARSQWHRGALFSEPQQYEIGVSKGESPTDTGRTASVPTTEHGGAVTPDNPVRGSFSDGAPKPARKRGPGYVWQYENVDTKVGVLTYPGDALKAQADNISDLRQKIQEALGVVFLDPENIKFAATTSGKALQAIKQKQIDRCGQYREDFRDGMLIPAIRMQLRITSSIPDDKAITLPGFAEARAELRKGEPKIAVQYGDFYSPDPAEQNQVLTMLGAAVKAGIIDRETAIEIACRTLKIADPEEVKLRLEEQQKRDDERMATELRRFKDDASAVPGNPPAVPAGGADGRPANG